jgi:histone acetyltransferase 1
MYLLGQIPQSHRAAGNPNIARLLVKKSRATDENDRRYYWWRMLVKQRLYKHHRDTLIQLEMDERIEKLDETLRNVEEGYENLLRAFTVKAASRRAVGGAGQKEAPGDEMAAEGEAGSFGTASRERGKRKYVVMEDEDEDEDVAEPESPDGSSKRPKV